MNEEFLHYVWQTKSFAGQTLFTEDGQEIIISACGLHNTDSGPDFKEARLKIGNTFWAGNVEIHIKSSDWNKHKHQFDVAYENVILHVVWQHDTEIRRQDNTIIPVLELKKYIPQSAITTYQNLQTPYVWIPCEKLLPNLDSIYIRMAEERALTERLERKGSQIETLLQKTTNDWQTSFYIILARNFGFNINTDAFERLAYSLPLSILAKHKDDLFSIEALLFGQAGLLTLTNDDYSKALVKEYNFLRIKYGLNPIEASMWKFMRTRPSNYPTLRLAQFASIIHTSNHLFSKLLECEQPQAAKALLTTSVSEYWTQHTRFGKKSIRYTDGRLSPSTVDIIMINTVIPFLFIYGKHHANTELQNRSLYFLESIASENNKFTKGWKQIGIHSENAFQSQALLELKKEWCSKKMCLSCPVGNKIIASSISL